MITPPDAGSSDSLGTEDAGRVNIDWDLGTPDGTRVQDVLRSPADSSGSVAVPNRDEGCGSSPVGTVWAVSLLVFGLLWRRRRLSQT